MEEARPGQKLTTCELQGFLSHRPLQPFPLSPQRNPGGKGVGEGVAQWKCGRSPVGGGGGDSGGDEYNL